MKEAGTIGGGWHFTPIGLFESVQVEPYHAGRQPDELGETGRVKLYPGHNYEQALQDLEGCTHIWLIFGFHKNENWKPMVLTPRAEKKVGVFATRAPYRPNPIGMSLVKLISVDGLTLTVGENDLLDGSPIFDIKPYHPESDSVDNASIEWLELAGLNKNAISFSPLAESQLDFLESDVPRLKAFITRQLEFDPTNKDKKRVENKDFFWTLSYRTWRIDFSYSDNSIGILNIHSGYSAEDFESSEDKYADKEIHRRFNKEFKN